MPRLRHALVAACALLVGTTGGSSAQDFPSRTIDWIAAFAAGGGTDRWARILSAGAFDVLGQGIHVRNMPGASGITAWQYVLEQPADGYTVYHGSSTPVLGLLSEAEPPFPPEQLRVVAYISSFQSILMTQPGQPWSDWEGFKAHLRDNPGSIAIGGTMSTLLGTAVILAEEGLEAIYVPYPSTGPAVTDMLGGHIHAATVTPASAIPLVPEQASVVLNASDIPLPEAIAAQLGNPPVASAEGYASAMSFPNLVGVHPDTPNEIVAILSEKIGELLELTSVKDLVAQIGEEIIFVPHDEAQERYLRMIEGMRAGLAYLQ
jgi:tripartite-type tricarboxylate transporter receptor subunit TctC